MTGPQLATWCKSRARCRLSAATEDRRRDTSGTPGVFAVVLVVRGNGDACAQATCRSASSRRSHSPMRFQLANLLGPQNWNSNQEASGYQALLTDQPPVLFSRTG
jgi:hypothetical protein